MYLAHVILAILVCLCFHTLLFVVPLTPCDGIVALLKGMGVAVPHHGGISLLTGKRTAGEVEHTLIVGSGTLVFI